MMSRQKRNGAFNKKSKCFCHSILGLKSKLLVELKFYLSYSRPLISTAILFFQHHARYLNSKKVERLKDLQEKHSLAESQLQKCENMKREISAELNKSKELLRNQDQLKRNIDDNLNYRKTKAEVDELTHEIESLEEKVLSIGSMSTIEAELKRHMQEKERLLSEVIVTY